MKTKQHISGRVSKFILKFFNLHLHKVTFRCSTFIINLCVTFLLELEAASIAAQDISIHY